MEADANTHIEADIKSNMKVKRDFTGVVLAGGKSSRMGTDKADLVLKNKTLLHNACDLLKDAGAKNILISRNIINPLKSSSHYSPSDYPSEKYVKDIYPNSGPLGGIYSTLIATEHDLLIIAVEVHFQSAKHVFVTDLIDCSHFVRYLTEKPALLRLTNYS